MLIFIMGRIYLGCYGRESTAYPSANELSSRVSSIILPTENSSIFLKTMSKGNVKPLLRIQTDEYTILE